MKVIAKINITGKDVTEVQNIAGGLQDIANLITENKANANDVVLLLSKVKENPDLVKTALNFL